MYWENQPELPSDKGSNWSRGATCDIGSPPLCTKKQQFSAHPKNWYKIRVHLQRKFLCHIEIMHFTVTLYTGLSQSLEYTSKHYRVLYCVSPNWCTCSNCIRRGFDMAVFILRNNCTELNKINTIIGIEDYRYNCNFYVS